MTIEETCMTSQGREEERGYTRMDMFHLGTAKEDCETYQDVRTCYVAYTNALMMRSKGVESEEDDCPNV